jgi:sialate O-acetylesterase
MVLQQKESVSVWGWAEPGEEVSVKGDWQWFKKTTKADKNGKWKTDIKTPEAGGPHTLTISGNNEIIFNDVLIGEVWICSGQSNMEFRMNMLGTDVANEDSAAAEFPQIRLFTVKKEFSVNPKNNVEGTWQVCTPRTVRDFSAVGYYFGNKLHNMLNVPVGLISTNWGGTPAEAWTSLEGLEPFDNFDDAIELIKGLDEIGAERRRKYQQKFLAWEQSVSDIDSGFQDQWYKPDIDDADWQTMEQPQEWSSTDLVDFDGIVWFRKKTSLPPSWSKIDLELNFGQIDDIDTVWVNGIRIGGTAGYTEPRRYKIPASVTHVGKNTIAVRIIDTYRQGGFTGHAEDMWIGPVGADAKTTASLAGTWKYKRAQKVKIPNLPVNSSKINQYTPTALYNAMIKPLISYHIAGAIWYQGESNCYDPILYRTLFPAMIEDWREQWDQGDFPFYYVQIAPFEYGSGAQSQAIREAQMMTLVDNVGMAVTVDIGEEKDIHPRNKHDVGDRLARWALAKTYGKNNIVYSGPIYKDMQVKNNKVRITFDYIDGGLVAKEGGLTDFEIAGSDRQFIPAKAIIDGDTVVVSSEAVNDPVAVRYGWGNWFQGSLFNKAGLPATSFRTDNWPLK